MSSPNPLVAAGAPELIAVLQALQQFITNLGTDPTKFAVTFPGALQILIGTAELTLPALATSEIGALQTAANAKIAAWIASIQAKA